MLIRVLYVSEIADAVSAADVSRLVAHAQRKNRQLDLTGALLVCDEHFVQALEGDERAVTRMMEAIAVDGRHHNLVMKGRVPIIRRLFATWDMAFIDDMQCKPALLNLLANRTTPEEFLEVLISWLEDRKNAPY